MSRGHGPPQLGTLSNPGRTLRLQHQFLPSQQTQHYQQTQPLTRGVAASGSHNGAKTLYATHGTIANAPRFNQNSYEVSPASSFRYYSSSVEYLAGDFWCLNFCDSISRKNQNSRIFLCTCLQFFVFFKLRLPAYLPCQFLHNALLILSFWSPNSKTVSKSSHY